MTETTRKYHRGSDGVLRYSDVPGHPAGFGWFPIGIRCIGCEGNMREEYMPVGTPDERAVARDFLLEYGAPEDAGLLPYLEQWDWPGMPPSWLRVDLGGRAYFVW